MYLYKENYDNEFFNKCLKVKHFFNVLYEITYDICLRQHPSLYTSPGVSRAPWIGYSVPKMMIHIHLYFYKINLIK